MFRSIFLFLLLLLSIGMLCWCPPISAHDTLYPHHREDFENMARRRELRSTVVISTIVFVGVMGAIIYLALRKSGADDETDETATNDAEKRECNRRVENQK